MLNLKKIWIFLLGIILPFWFSLQYTQWWLSTGDPRDPEINEESTTKIDGKETEDIDQWSHWMSEESKWILHLPKPENYNTWLWYVMALIQIALNWLLWILALVALVYMIYCGILVLTSWSDDKNASKGKKGIRTAAIALAWIGLSRLIVSAIIRFITEMTDKWMAME
jgi:hypothetical protein